MSIEYAERFSSGRNRHIDRQARAERFHPLNRFNDFVLRYEKRYAVINYRVSFFIEIRRF